MADPVLVVRVSANLTDLRKAMQEGTSEVLTTKREMSNLSNAFDGSRIISQAGAVVGSIQAMGGTTKLTAQEQATANRILEAAIEKYQALGREAPKSMLDLAAATRTNDAALRNLDQYGVQAIDRFGNSVASTTPKVGGLRVAYSQFDNILQASGVNIGPYARGLEDVARVALSGSAALGPLGIAAVAVASAFALWKLAKSTEEIDAFRTKIGQATASLLGYGDVAAQTAAAKQDVLNRAIAEGADRTIKYAEATEYLANAHKQKLNDALIATGGNIANAYKELRTLSDAKRADIQRSIELGGSEESLARHYRVSIDLIQILKGRKELAAEAAEKHEAALKKEEAALDRAAAAYRAYNNWLGERRLEDEGAALKQLAEQQAMFNDMDIKARLARQQAITNQSAAEAVAEAQRIEANQKEIDGLLQVMAANQDVAASSQSATDTAIRGFQGVAQQVTVTGDAIKEWIGLLRYQSQVQAILSENSLFTSVSQRQRIAAIPGRASGGPVSAGAPYMVGERGPELFVPERSGTIVPNGAGGAVYHVTNHIHVDGSILSTAAQLRDAVSGALVDVFRSGSLPIPANV